MNIFYLDRDPSVAAQMHCDQHVVKMILESAQMLSTAHRFFEKDQPWCDSKGLYKMTHVNHPSTMWARTSTKNYKWLHSLLVNLCEEYTRRYGKKHATERLIEPLQRVPDYLKRFNKFTDPPQCMPDEYKRDCAVAGYREFYKGDKSRFAAWKKTRPAPVWWEK